MEFPRTVLIFQRALALLFLVAAVGAAVVERTSPLSACLREGRPWPFWLAVREPGRLAAPALHLGVYDTLRRRLVLIRIPEHTRLQGRLTVGRAYADALSAVDDESSATRAVEDLTQAKLTSLSLEPLAWDAVGRLDLALTPSEEDDEPAVAAARALKSRGHSPRALASIALQALRGLAQGDKTSADALFLAFELRRTAFDGLEPAVLPDDAAAPDFLARTFAAGPPPADDGKAVMVEVLNGTDVQGLAAQAAKILRSRGIDVMEVKQSSHPRARTVVYDRIGSFERAARVREALGCPTAITATRIDALRGVDASVELGGDCTF